MAVAAGNKAVAPQVVVGEAELATVIEEIPLSGTVTSPQVAKLSTSVGGLVQAVLVDAGDRVKAGDPVLKLDQELEALSLRASRAVSEQAREELADAKRRLTDAETLAKRHTISANELRSLEAEVRIDSAKLQRFSAEQQRQEARLQRYQVLAPFGGVISRKLVEAGEWVQPGDPVAELVATEGLRIDFQAPQAEFARVTLASDVRISLDAFSGQIFEGRIQAIVPVSDSAARTFMIRVVPDTEDVALIPGMSASGVLRLRTAGQGVVVSRDALLRYPDGRVTVWVVNRGSDTATVSERRVVPGPGFNGQVAITSGLEPGTLVVLQGNEALKEGQAINIQNKQ